MRVKISASSLLFSEPKPLKQPKKPQGLNQLSLSLKNRFQGSLSSASRGYLKSLLSRWFYDVKCSAKLTEKNIYRINRLFSFVTLTLPSEQYHTHKEIKRGPFNSFLVSLQRDFPNLRYLWKAELQKNGNIHFHLLIDCFVDWKIIRQKWNSALSNYGYISKYQTRCLHQYRNDFNRYKSFFPGKDISKIKKAFQHGISSNWSDPNSTDIHALRSKRNAIQYVCKYVAKGVAKNEGGFLKKHEPIQDFGRIWGCSDSLRSLPDNRFELDFNDYQDFKSYFKPKFTGHFSSDYYWGFNIDFSSFFQFMDFFHDHFPNLAAPG